MIEITEVRDFNKDGAEDISDIEYLLRNNKNTLTILDGDGDFRSEECIGFLEEADVVVTNPPFSLFREYVAQLIKYNKKFIILGNNNAITYKEIFSLIMENKLWLGYGVNKTIEFRLSDSYKKWSRIDNGVKYGNVPAISWFTNVDIDKRHEEMILFQKYSADKYPNYDNYDAINIDRVNDIPYDYDGVMGVPITFLDKYNPNQFVILGKTDRQAIYGYRNKIYTKKDATNYNDLNRGPALFINGKLKAIYQRIFIKRRKNEN